MLPVLPDWSDSARKLFTPREQREQMLDAKFSSRRPVDGCESVICWCVILKKWFNFNMNCCLRLLHELEVVILKNEKEFFSQLKIPKQLPTLPSEKLVRWQTVNNLNHVECIASLTPATTTTGRSAVKSNPPLFHSHHSKQHNNALIPHTVSNSSSHSNNSAHTRFGSTSVFLRSNSNRSNYTHVSLRASGLRWRDCRCGLVVEERSQVNGTEKGTGKGFRGGKWREKRQKIDDMKCARNGQTMCGDGGVHRGWESEVQRDTHPADFYVLSTTPRTC